MKRCLGLMMAVGMMGGILSGCSYAGTAASGERAVVLRNDGFLFGILRKAYVCRITDAGLSACNANESP